MRLTEIENPATVRLDAEIKKLRAEIEQLNAQLILTRGIASSALGRTKKTT